MKFILFKCLYVNKILIAFAHFHKPNIQQTMHSLTDWKTKINYFSWCSSQYQFQHIVHFLGFFGVWMTFKPEIPIDDEISNKNGTCFLNWTTPFCVYTNFVHELNLFISHDNSCECIYENNWPELLSFTREAFINLSEMQYGNHLKPQKNGIYKLIPLRSI